MDPLCGECDIINVFGALLPIGAGRFPGAQIIPKEAGDGNGNAAAFPNCSAAFPCRLKLEIWNQVIFLYLSRRKIDFQGRTVKRVNAQTLLTLA
jgi:hypothetical protein